MILFHIKVSRNLIFIKRWNTKNSMFIFILFLCVYFSLSQLNYNPLFNVRIEHSHHSNSKYSRRRLLYLFFDWNSAFQYTWMANVLVFSSIVSINRNILTANESDECLMWASDLLHPRWLCAWHNEIMYTKEKNIMRTYDRKRYECNFIKVNYVIVDSHLLLRPSCID